MMISLILQNGEMVLPGKDVIRGSVAVNDGWIIGILASTAKKGLRCANAGPGARRWAPVPRSWSRPAPMRAGRWISSMTNSLVAGSSVS